MQTAARCRRNPNSFPTECLPADPIQAEPTQRLAKARALGAHRQPQGEQPAARISGRSVHPQLPSFQPRSSAVARAAATAAALGLSRRAEPPIAAAGGLMRSCGAEGADSTLDQGSPTLERASGAPRAAVVGSHGAERAESGWGHDLSILKGAEGAPWAATMPHTRSNGEEQREGSAQICRSSVPKQPAPEIPPSGSAQAGQSVSKSHVTAPNRETQKIPPRRSAHTGQSVLKSCATTPQQTSNEAPQNRSA
jgi:hypothetical protein